jgi:hypothetical protein
VLRTVLASPTSSSGRKHTFLVWIHLLAKGLVVHQMFLLNIFNIDIMSWWVHFLARYGTSNGQIHHSNQCATGTELVAGFVLIYQNYLQ